MSPEPIFVAAIALLLYFLMAILLAHGIRRGGLVQPQKQQTGALPQVCVIVAARNEAENLPACLESLLALDYPEERLQIWIADDASEDATGEIAEVAAQQHGHVHLLRVRDRIPGLNGKANALHQAIERASGEIILVTDADCRVPPCWVRGHVQQYDSETVMVGGFVLLVGRKERASLFEKLQAFDWLYLTAAGAGAAGLGIPLSIFGNNFSFRREAYAAAGGFPGSGFSVIEDFALMQTISRKTGKRVKLVAAPGLAVLSRPVRRLSALYGQRKRWALGARNIAWLSRGLLALAAMCRSLPFLLFPFKPPFAAAAFAALLAGDVFIANTAARHLRRTDLLPFVLPYQFFAPAYFAALLPAFLFARTVSWKDRAYPSAKISMDSH